MIPNKFLIKHKDGLTGKEIHGRSGGMGNCVGGKKISGQRALMIQHQGRIS
jgi:hypothetical protein